MKYFLLLTTLFIFSLNRQLQGQAVDRVTLESSTIQWQTFAYELTDDNSIVYGSFDANTIVERTFETWILENEYLRVTLLPEFGGRILSLIYKPTGHEQLYQNPVGTPYLIDQNIFYYDWLMIYGGIFPTFPEPEHGKSWLLEWDFEVISDSDDEVTVRMSFVDDIAYAGAPQQYNVGQTNLEVDFYITLSAGRAALDTRVELRNPTAQTVQYEYWMNAGLAPGSEVGNSATTDAAEIIAPITQVSIPDYWTAIIAQEEAVGGGIYAFDALRDFENWTDMGIAYAYPDMGGQNFWGVINHANEEGIFRVADNTITRGLKIWTFGYPSVSLDLFVDGNEWRRPFIEMWAGITPEFWQRATFAANSEIVMEESYSPSVGLSNVTHASDRLLVNAFVDGEMITLQLFSMFPEEQLEVNVFSNGETRYTQTITADALAGNVISVPATEGELTFVVRDAANNLILEGSINRRET